MLRGVRRKAGPCAIGFAKVELVFGDEASVAPVSFGRSVGILGVGGSESRVCGSECAVGVEAGSAVADLLRQKLGATRRVREAHLRAVPVSGGGEVRIDGRIQHIGGAGAAVRPRQRRHPLALALSLVPAWVCVRKEILAASGHARGRGRGRAE